MKQTVSAILGALAGTLVWLSLRASHPEASVFGWAVTGAWFGVGLHALAFGELTLAGRGSKVTRSFVGTLARLIGCLMAAMSAGFVAWL